MNPSTTLPDLARPDVGLVMVGEWRVDGPERQRAAVAAALAAWERVPWPEGLLAHHSYVGADERTVLHYSQWTDGAAVDEFYRTDPPERVTGILAAVPEIERIGVTRYEPYRHRSYAALDPGAPPPVVVAPEYETRGPAHARAWIDAMLEEAAAAAAAAPIPGLIAAHWHVSEDGSRALLCAEWADAEANERFRESSTLGRAAIEDHGVRPLGGRVLHLAGSRTDR